MKLRFFLLSFLVYTLLTASFSSALTYKNLTPGVSQKADADNYLGAPIQTIQPGFIYAYSPEIHDLKTLLVRFNNDGVIDNIQLIFKTPYKTSDIKHWLNLGKADSFDIDTGGNKIEQYLSKGIILQFHGMDDTIGVTGMMHIKKVVEAKKSSIVKIPNFQTKKSIPSKPSTPFPGSNTYNYLGGLISSQSGVLTVINTYPDSPARKAGVEMGDRLLKIDGTRLSGMSDKSFSNLIQNMKGDKPVIFEISRDNIIKKIQLALVKTEKDQILKKHQEYKAQAETFYKKAEQQKKDDNYKLAAENYKKALLLDPTDSWSYDYYAYSIDKIGKRKTAYFYLEMSLRLKDKMFNNYLYGKFLSLDQKYKEALPYLEKACKKVKPKSTYYFPYRELGGAKYMLDDHQGTVKALSKAVEMGDKWPLTIGTLAIAYDKTKEYQKAVKYYREYLALKSSNQKMNRVAQMRLKKLRNKMN